MVKQLATKEEFDATLAEAGDKLVVVDFTASWCGPCKKIGPVFASLAVENSDVIFVKVDVDENDETAVACGVEQMPNFQFYKKGTKVDELTGADESLLKSKLANLKTSAVSAPADCRAQAQAAIVDKDVFARPPSF